MLAFIFAAWFLAAPLYVGYTVWNLRRIAKRMFQPSPVLLYRLVREGVGSRDNNPDARMPSEEEAWRGPELQECE
jgi:hypothetical protein